MNVSPFVFTECVCDLITSFLSNFTRIQLPVCILINPLHVFCYSQKLKEEKNTLIVQKTIFIFQIFVQILAFLWNISHLNLWGRLNNNLWDCKMIYFSFIMFYFRGEVSDTFQTPPVYMYQVVSEMLFSTWSCNSSLFLLSSPLKRCPRLQTAPVFIPSHL